MKIRGAVFSDAEVISILLDYMNKKGIMIAESKNWMLVQQDNNEIDLYIPEGTD